MKLKVFVLLVNQNSNLKGFKKHKGPSLFPFEFCSPFRPDNMHGRYLFLCFDIKGSNGLANI